MTLDTGDNRYYNPYKAGFLSFPSLTPQPLNMGSSLVKTGHLLLQSCSRVIPNPSKSLKSSRDSATIVGMKTRQNPIPVATVKALGFGSIVHHLLLSALGYIGVFLNYMCFKSAINSHIRARYLASDHFFKSRQVFTPGLSPRRAYTEQQVLISCHSPHPCYPSMIGLVLKKLVILVTLFGRGAFD